jgi:hypothetical protein
MKIILDLSNTEFVSMTDTLTASSRREASLQTQISAMLDSNGKLRELVSALEKEGRLLTQSCDTLRADLAYLRQQSTAVHYNSDSGDFSFPLVKSSQAELSKALQVLSNYLKDPTGFVSLPVAALAFWAPASQGLKIGCIKLARAATNCGLKEAKDLVEENLFP